MKQLNFTLLDLIQLGDIVPFFNTATKDATPDRHEVHDNTDKLLVSSYNKFDEEYNQLTNELCGDGDTLSVQMVRGAIFMKYREILNKNETPTISVTADNIDQVKVVLIGNASSRTKPTDKSIYWAFKILPPYHMPEVLDRDSAKVYFDDIKARRNFQPGEPQLSWWVLHEIKAEFLK